MHDVGPMDLLRQAMESSVPRTLSCKYWHFAQARLKGAPDSGTQRPARASISGAWRAPAWRLRIIEPREQTHASHEPVHARGDVGIRGRCR